MIPESLYHIYNRGNNKQRIFFQERNYHYFLRKVKVQLTPYLEILAYCLMPNHFHFLAFSKGDINTKKYSTSLGKLLSSYTRAIQNQEGLVGSLFQQNTKAKDVNDLEYAQTCFHYIHQNPLKSKLVKKMEDWPHHSFNEYWKGEKGICNVALAIELLAIPTTQDQFYRESYNVVTGDYSLPWLSGSTTSSGGTTSITK